MKRIFLYFLLLYMMPSLMAETKIYTLDNTPNVRLSNIRSYVSDPENILSQLACDSINSMLYNLERKTGIETAVVVLPSIGDAEIQNFAYQLGRKWGVGKKKNNNGLVLLLVIDQRKITFATGYGLEGDLPDAICKRIQTKAMIPSFHQNDWNTGLVRGVKYICGTLDGSMSANDDEDDDAGGYFGIALFLMIFCPLFIVILKNRFTNRCPNCKKRGLQRTNSYVVSRYHGVKHEMVTYTCRYCGHQVKREEKDYDENVRGHGFGGPFIGGGSFGGGGFSGGSFGGGSFGGGGSTSGF
jgi:uncharacterized protein